MSDVIAILQARMSSSRLPGKVLKPILGLPMLAHQVARIKQSKRLCKLIIATSNEASDQPIADFCENAGVHCYQGSLPDVLDRFYQTAIANQAKVIVRLTGDCPLIDAEIIDEAIDIHLTAGNEYTTNSILPDHPTEKFTYADGLDVEVINVDVLASLWKNTTKSYYREHVTSYVRTHEQAFKVGYFHHQPDISAYRLTVDEPEDFELITEVFHHFQSQGSVFGYRDVIAYIAKNPKLHRLNHSHNLFHE